MYNRDIDGLGIITYVNDYSDGDYVLKAEEISLDVTLYDPKSNIIKERYRQEYDYSSITLSAYKNEEKDENKISIIYELLVNIDGEYHLLEKFNSVDGSLVIPHLCLNQIYYVVANDVSNTYKSQMAKFITSEKDQNMIVTLIENYNYISDIGFNYTFFLKNIVDPNPYVYISDHPKLKMIKGINGSYVISGTPSNRLINLTVEYEKGLIVNTESFELNIVGSSTPVKSNQHILYEAPYRILKNKNPNIDELLITKPNYSRVMIQSAFVSDLNLNYNLYQSLGGVSYTKDTPYDFSPTFKLSIGVNQTNNILSIKDVIGDLNSNDVIIVGNERMLIESYSITLNQITVKRGIDGTVPKIHAVDQLVFVERINISNLDYGKETVKFNYSSSTFSNETIVNPLDDITLVTTGLANKPYPPMNVKIDGEYFPNIATSATELILTWDTRLPDGNITGYYDNISNTIPNISYRLDVFEIDRVGVESTMKTITVYTNTYTVDLRNTLSTTVKYRIKLVSVRNEIFNDIRYDFNHVMNGIVHTTI